MGHPIGKLFQGIDCFLARLDFDENVSRSHFRALALAACLLDLDAMMSVFDVGLETGGLLLAVGIMYFNGDLRRGLSVDKGNVWMFFPFLALVASMLFFAVDLPIIPLVYHIGYSKLFATIVLAHLVLVGFLAVSTFQGLRKISDTF